MQKYIVEATSTVSMADAAVQAMAKAAMYLSENHDIRIAVLEMAAVRGKGYRVVLEVVLVPLSRGESTGSKSEDVEPKTALARKEQERIETIDKSIKRRIMDHFRKRRGTYIDTPTIHLAQLTEAMLIGQIDSEFRANALPPIPQALGDPTLVVKDPPPKPPEDHIEQDFEHASHPEGDEPPKTPDKKPAPHADPE
ncbi:MAG TPA: hypothetical protein VL625_07655 [Patescibacteria group bacterium]|jgi:hypothetical protein|nr:hypothetical protein [Patescibacteria group bacterium]